MAQNSSNNFFDASVFFIIFRETLEVSIIISVLLTFLKQGVGGSSQDSWLYQRLVRQVWIGSGVGFGICLGLGAVCIAAWYRFGKDIWGATEDIWEGAFCTVASVLISIMGLAMLRLNKMQEKWRVKIAKSLAHPNSVRSFSSRYAMGILPLVTVLRESIEAIVFIGGVSLSAPPSSIPLSVLAGVMCGAGVGYFIYKGGNHVKIQVFLIVSTCFLYIVAAALLSRAVWYFENYQWSLLVGGDVAETGSGPGSYDVRKSVWHVNCCNPLTDDWWMIFQALLGWQNSATYGSVVSYNLYWLAVIFSVCLLAFKERYGHLPFVKLKDNDSDADSTYPLIGIDTDNNTDMGPESSPSCSSSSDEELEIVAESSSCNGDSGALRP
ncbi:iron permease FTR1 family-domain-containing protein [Lipomyces tetrasporus]|uniref:Iron permease FTR1 family-domain-containing protein n=1 Tax=Lipomyces tetrasporus TaxID=54092 RepID=A0AAD7QUC8_9ASCO|nr:iron permease FTR1 family-domain-containing protein [Lipomyces tetrasporus]KAJ8101668.1 iron permease FTR1 family-domain-containing protein [Lipomyces tetrasporus]